VSQPALIWIELPLVLALHDRLLVFHGGAEGLRDEGLLLSALARPKHLAAYGIGSDVIDMAAAYTFGIVKNYPCLDGNKRTGFVTGVLFLERNGYRFSAPQDAAAAAVLDLAAGVIDEAGYDEFLRKHSSNHVA
jgi:death-on-curing protein